MAFASQIGLDILSTKNVLAFLFNEEAGVVIQIDRGALSWRDAP